MKCRRRDGRLRQEGPLFLPDTGAAAVPASCPRSPESEDTGLCCRYSEDTTACYPEWGIRVTSLSVREQWTGNGECHYRAGRPSGQRRTVSAVADLRGNIKAAQSGSAAGLLRGASVHAWKKGNRVQVLWTGLLEA